MTARTAHARARKLLCLVPLFVVMAAATVARAELPANDNPLSPPDTSSPRATLNSFISGADAIFTELTTGSISQAKQASLRHHATFLLNCLDLSNLAPSIANSQGREAAVTLKEVLDRIPLPDPAEIPDAAEMKDAGLTRWRVPGTEITIVKISDGERAGEYLFSVDTVARAPEFYQRIRHLPYRADAGSKGLYEVYCQVGGWMIPRHLIQALPEWMRASYADHTVWQWISSGVLIVGSVSVVLWMLGVYRRLVAAGHANRWFGRIFRVMFPTVMIFLALFLDFFLTYQIRLTGDVLIAIKLSLRICMFLGAILIVLYALNRVSDLVIHTRRLRPEAIDTQLVRLGFRVLTFIVVAWLVVLGADYIGVSVTPLMAGLGASGLAVALASQHTVENLIAGIVLFADKPVRIGDNCQFGDIRGTVEEIGLRSTRIRGIDRAVVSIPNAEFAKLQLTNYTRRDQIPLKTVLQLRYETTGDQLRYVMAQLRNMLVQHPRISHDAARVRFVKYGEYSLDVELYALVQTRDWNDFLSVQEDILLRIMDVVNAAGSGFAFPTQVQFTPQDSVIDTARVKHAEAQVQSWRASGLLEAAGFAPDNSAASPAAPNPVIVDPPQSPAKRGPIGKLRRRDGLPLGESSYQNPTQRPA